MPKICPKCGERLKIFCKSCYDYAVWLDTQSSNEKIELLEKEKKELHRLLEIRENDIRFAEEKISNMFYKIEELEFKLQKLGGR